MSDLLPCPICGREVEYESFERLGGDHKYGVRVLCDHDSPSTESAVYAEAVGKTFREAEEALLDEWNTRHERTCKFIDGRDDRGPKTPKCSVCGYQPILPQWTVEGEPKTGVYIERYCPLCGSKVMKDE